MSNTYFVSLKKSKYKAGDSGLLESNSLSYYVVSSNVKDATPVERR
jgi:hypothetical protein